MTLETSVAWSKLINTTIYLLQKWHNESITKDEMKRLDQLLEIITPTVGLIVKYTDKK